VERTRRLRELVASGRTVVALGASDALSARVIESHGFDCLYIGSYATAASRFARRDSGLLEVGDLVEQARTIAAAVRVPVIADGEGGFDDAAGTVRAFEAAGVAAIHLEDHLGAGKHTKEPQSLRPVAEMAARIRSAVAARTDPDFIIVARSDAVWLGLGLDEAVKRLAAYAEAGADMVFPTAVDPQQLAQVRRRIARPAMIVDMPGRRLDEHKDAAIVLYYGFSVLAQFDALNRAIERFKTAGEPPGDADGFERFMGY
jgi:2-methylisocitrate lyase-like PEP mutase family enzyme